VCEMRFFFDDGHEEVVQHSPFRAPQNADGTNPGDVVRIFYRGHDRAGSQAALSSILSEPKS
jgi:hypothetical protein